MSYAAIIIGSGQGGTPLASAFAKAGHKTALIESTHIGGTCVNEGCTPTKTMVASARVAHLASRARDYGVEFPSPFTVNMETVRKRKRDIVDRFRGGNEARIKAQAHLDLFMGTASFVSPKEVKITLNSPAGETKTITGEKIFINAGCRPTPLHIPGIEHVPASNLLDSTSIMELSSVPAHLVVIGGGYVGVEFAQMFRRFGSRVTIIQRGGQLLGREDPDIATAVQEILEQDGITVHLNTAPAAIFADGAGASAAFHLDVRPSPGHGNEHRIPFSHLLAASGRSPNTPSLNLAAAGIPVNARGFVPTSDTLETVVPGIFALGDIRPGPQFTHISYDDFRVIRTNHVEGGHRTIAGRPVPYTVFMDPQLGRVGLTETEARAQPRAVKVAKMPMTSVARALETDESRGLMKAVVDAASGEILGFACLGIEGGEVMSMVQMAMMGRLPYTALRDAVWAHPCLSESLNNLWGYLE